MLDPLELEFQIVVSHHKRVLGIEVESSQERNQVVRLAQQHLHPLASASPDLCCYLLFPSQQTLNYLH